MSMSVVLSVTLVAVEFSVTVTVLEPLPLVRSMSMFTSSTLLAVVPTFVLIVFELPGLVMLIVTSSLPPLVPDVVPNCTSMSELYHW